MPEHYRDARRILSPDWLTCEPAGPGMKALVPMAVTCTGCSGVNAGNSIWLPGHPELLGMLWHLPAVLCCIFGIHMAQAQPRGCVW